MTRDDISKFSIFEVELLLFDKQNTKYVKTKKKQ